MSFALALLIIRVVVGLTLVAHGTQKLFGWFGGPGYAKLEQGFKTQGYRPVQLWAALVILGEVGGGLSLAFGFLTPLGAAGALGAMVMAIKTHWRKGFFNSKGGYEYPLALLAMSVAIGFRARARIRSIICSGLPCQSLVFIVLALAATHRRCHRHLHHTPSARCGAAPQDARRLNRATTQETISPARCPDPPPRRASSSARRPAPPDRGGCAPQLCRRWP